jgi:hypothetical protein
MLSKKVYEKRFNRLLTVVIKKTRSFCSVFLSNKGTYLLCFRFPVLHSLAR